MVAFVVEDGTGLSTATSYVDVTFSDDYLGATWAVDTATKQSALISATEYADARWGELLKSKPLLETQALELPRFQLYDRYGNLIEGVPDDWKKAVCLYAQSSVAGALYPTPSTASSKDVKRKKTVVGPITTELEYQGASTDASWLKFPLADRLVKQYTYVSSGVMRA